MNALLIAGIGVAIAAALFIWTVYLPKRRNSDPVQKQWIIETLRSIKAEADRKRLHLHATPKIDVAGAFTELRKLTEGDSQEIGDKINALEERWQELSTQFAAFENSQPGSTLQNSVLASRTSKLASDIGRLADEIERDLDSA